MASRLINSQEVRLRFGGISAVTLCKYRKIGKVPKPVDEFTTHPLWLESDIERALEAFRGCGCAEGL